MQIKTMLEFMQTMHEPQLVQMMIRLKLYLPSVEWEMLDEIVRTAKMVGANHVAIKLAEQLPSADAAIIDVINDYTKEIAGN